MKLTNLVKNALMTLCIAGFVTGCATMKGFGEDVEEAGKAMQEAADK